MENNMNWDLKFSLLEAGISQRQLAHNTGIAEDKISKIVRGYCEPKDAEKEKIFKFITTVSE